MTNQTLAVSLVVAAVIGLVAGLIGRRYRAIGFLSSLAFGLGVAVSIPVLLGLGQTPSRWLQPRQALEWIPAGLLLWVAAAAGVAGDSRRKTAWLVVGALVGLALAGRMMWGSVYLRPASLDWTNVAAIAGWGLALAGVWMAGQRGDRPSPRLGGTVDLLLLLMVAVILGTTGSMLYGAVGLLLVVAFLASWLGAGVSASLALPSALLLLGLGPTFAGTPWPLALAMATAIVIQGCAAHSGSARLRGMAMALALVLAVSATVVAANSFVQSVAGKPQGASGYEAYR